MTVEYIQPTAEQLARVKTMVQRLTTGVVPRGEVLALDGQIPDTYINRCHIGGRGYVSFLECHPLDLSVRLERVGDGYTGKVYR